MTGQTTTHLLIVCQKLWLNESGSGVDYIADGREFADRSEAIRWACDEHGHDDFNIATVREGRLVAFGYGMEDFPADGDEPHGGHDLAEIARQIGVKA